MNELLVVHALRPDRLLASCHRLVASAFGVEFMQQDKIVNLREIVENEVCLIYCRSCFVMFIGISNCVLSRCQRGNLQL